LAEYVLQKSLDLGILGHQDGKSILLRVVKVFGRVNSALKQYRVDAILCFARKTKETLLKAGF